MGKLSLLLLSVMLMSQETQAQLNPLGIQYFSNQYLGNPAMAGLKGGLNLNLDYRKQWSSIPGAPATQSLTADYGVNEKVGLGLNVYNDKAGLLKRTRVLGTYSYHLPLNDKDQKLSFGVSLGFMNERLDNFNIQGDEDDIEIGRFNDRKTYVDADFGMAYSSNKLTVQGVLPGLKRLFSKDELNDETNLPVFFTALSYKFQFDEGKNGVGLEPKVCYRGVKGYDNLWDAGANLVFLNNQLSFLGMYHSSRSTTFGVGLNYNSALSINCMYTTEAAALRGYTEGDFEIGLGLSF